MPDVVYTRTFMLKDVLLKLGISQRKLSKLLHKTQDWVSRLHNGRNLPSWDTACKIAEVLGVSVGVFADQDPAQLAFFTRVAPPAPPPTTTPKRRPRPAQAKGA